MADKQELGEVGAYITRDGNVNNYAGWYFSTEQYGPGSQYYDPDTVITNSQFPQLHVL